MAAGIAPGTAAGGAMAGPDETGALARAIVAGAGASVAGVGNTVVGAGDTVAGAGDTVGAGDATVAGAGNTVVGAGDTVAGTGDTVGAGDTGLAAASSSAGGASSAGNWAARDRALAAARIAPLINFDGNIKCSSHCTVRSHHDRLFKNTMCPVRAARLRLERVE
jgi:hypothetical protein